MLPSRLISLALFCFFFFLCIGISLTAGQLPPGPPGPPLPPVFPPSPPPPPPSGPLPDLPVNGPAPFVPIAKRSLVIPNQYVVQTTNSSVATDILSRLGNTFSNLFPSAIRAVPIIKYSYTSDVFPGFALNIKYVDYNNASTSVLPTPTQIQIVISAILAIPGIVMVEEDFLVNLSATTTIPYQSTTNTWGLDRVDQRSRLSSGDGRYYYNSTGNGVTVYVIDTGIRKSHSELEGRASWGYSAFNDQANCEDGQGHGTHVSGIIGGKTVGVAKSVKLVAVQVLDSSGSGSNSGVISGVNWVANNANPTISIASMSLGGSASSALDTAVSNAIAKGLTFTIAAGNNNISSCDVSPARVNTAITVSATDRNDDRASYSNWGTCSQIFAPGSEIYSLGISDDNAYRTLSGTSMATPFVAGVAALYLAKFPGTSPSQLRSDLVCFSTKDAVSDPQGTPNRLLFSFVNRNSNSNSGDSGNPSNPINNGGASNSNNMNEQCTTTSPCTTTSYSTNYYGQTIRVPTASTIDQAIVINGTTGAGGYLRAWLKYDTSTVNGASLNQHYLYLYKYDYSSSNWVVAASVTDSTNPKYLIYKDTTNASSPNANNTVSYYYWLVQSRAVTTVQGTLTYKLPIAPINTNSTVPSKSMCGATVDYDPNPNNPNQPSNSTKNSATASSANWMISFVLLSITMFMQQLFRL